jgi:stearoyl-CoA desaturase (delta-9 desaturase)
LWLWLSTGMVTKEWAAIHRKHHAKCETAEDPHSPQVFGIHGFCGRASFSTSRRPETPKPCALRPWHTHDWIENHLYSPWHKLGVVLMLAIDMAVFGVLPGR